MRKKKELKARFIEDDILAEDNEKYKRTLLERIRENPYIITTWALGIILLIIIIDNIIGECK